MAEYINIAVREHAEKRMTWECAAGDSYKESTGRREVTKYSGLWSELQSTAAGCLATGGDGLQVTCELERLEGGIGELTVTQEWFKPSDSGDPGDDSGGNQPESDELGSEGAPCLTCSSSPVVVSLLAHPKFAGMGNMERRALKAMIDGQDENSLIELDETGANGAPVYGKIRDCINSDAALKAFSYVARGVVEYMDFSTEATLRWKGRSEKYQNGEIVKSLPGRRGVSQDRDWICVGTGIEKNGAEVWSTASFRLSSAGGWDAYLYS